MRLLRTIIITTLLAITVGFIYMAYKSIKDIKAVTSLTLGK